VGDSKRNVLVKAWPFPNAPGWHAMLPAEVFGASVERGQLRWRGSRWVNDRDGSLNVRAQGIKPAAV